MYASRWAANPLRRKEPDRWDPDREGGSTIDRP